MPQALHSSTALRRLAAGGLFGVAVIVAGLMPAALPGAIAHAAEGASDDPFVRALEPLLAAEFAIQSGRLDDAARWYLQAAQATGDLELAERATRIALLARDDARAADALEL